MIEMHSVLVGRKVGQLEAEVGDHDALDALELS